jgi:hypothetical protein
VTTTVSHPPHIRHSFLFRIMFAKSFTTAFVAAAGLAQTAFAQGASQLQLAGVKANFERTSRGHKIPGQMLISCRRGPARAPVLAHL